METLAKLEIEGKAYVVCGDVDDVCVTVADCPFDDKDGDGRVSGMLSLHLSRDEWKNVLALLQRVI